jgi:hypothetical protein
LAHLFDSFTVCPRPILVVCGLLPGDNNLTRGCQGAVCPPIFIPCSPTGESGKNSETGFMRWSPVCHYRKQWVARGKFSIYIVKVNFSKVVAFTGTIRKFLNTLAVHIEGKASSPYALLTHFVRVNVPLK